MSTATGAQSMAVTIFGDRYAQRMGTYEWSAEQLAGHLREPRAYPSKEACPLIKLARFGDQRTDKGSLRHDGNVLDISGIEADYDGGEISLAEAQMRLHERNIDAVFYTSASHTPEKPRWRVLCPLSRSYSPSERARFVARLNGALGGILAPESFVLSQSYYVGRVAGATYEFAQVRGRPIDLLAELDAAAIAPEKAGDSRAERARQTRGTDSVIARLEQLGLVLRPRTDLGVDMVCPFESEHTTPRAPADCCYFPAHTGGFAKGHFRCLHSHCAQRSDDDFLRAIGLAEPITPDAEQDETPPSEGFVGSGGDARKNIEWPKPQPLPAHLPPVKRFELDLLPDELRGWVQDIADRVQCPIEFPAVASIVALGSVIGRKLAVRPKARDDWEEFPNLWGVIVGRSGVLKTPALQEALRPLRALEAQAQEAHGEALADWQAAREGARVKRDAARIKARKAAAKGNEFDAAGLVLNDEQEEPQAKRYIVNDSSIEALGLVLQGSPTGVLAYRDELIGLLKSLDRDGMEGARAFYLSAYNGKEAHVYDRIGRGLNIRVEHCCVSMLGSIQPEIIGTYLRDAFENAGGDGLLSRFSLLVWPDVTTEWRNVDRWPDSDARKQARELFDRMDNLEPAMIGAEVEEGRPPFLRFDADALGRFVDWRKDYEQKQRDSDEHPALVAHFAKYRKLVPALALIFHLASRGSGPITEAAALRALAWAELLETHARRAYASIQRARTEVARALLAKITAGQVSNPIRPRDVYLKGWSGLSDPESVRRALELLEDLDYVRSEILQTPGRSKTVYRINPWVRP